MKKRTLRSLLSLVILISMLAAACGSEEDEATEPPPPTEKPMGPTATTVAIKAEEATPTPTLLPETKFNEAPMLAEMVAAGELPPVDERLPTQPVVVPVHESIGKYGGTWYNVTDRTDFSTARMATYDPLYRWNEDYSGYKPGLAESWEFNADGTELTWRLREGVKWSDGEPFTTEDLRFWWEDMATNDEYGVVDVPFYGFDANGGRMEVTFPDDYTMVWKWGTPNWLAPYYVAQGFWEPELLMKPAHYLKQFHPQYNPDADYWELELIDKWYRNPDYPTTMAWHVEEYVPAERLVLVRNPFYWKVDAEGNQLPYIDRIDVTIIPDKEVRVLELSQGKANLSFRGTEDPRDIPFLSEQAESGGYRLMTGWMNGAGGWPCWLINQDYVPDEEVRDLLRNTLFRKGVSVALNRDRLIDVVWGGIGVPQQATISPQSWHFASPEGQEIFEQWQQSDAEYDPDLAKRRFDEIGFVDVDGDGWRDLLSGKFFELILNITGWGTREVSIPANELLKGDLEAVGVRVRLNNVIDIPEDGLSEKESTFMFRNCYASAVDIWTYPDWIFPLWGGGEGSRSWPMEGKWKQTGGVEGWEPEPGSPAARLQAIYDQGVTEPDEQKRHELVWEAIRIHFEDGPFTLGAAGDQQMPVIIAPNVHNVPETGILGPWAPASPGNKHPEQFWIEQ